MPDGEAVPKKKSSFLGKLIEWLAITLIAAGAGFALSALGPPAAPPEKSADGAAAGKLPAETKASETPVAAACAPDGAGLVDLPPIVTNVATPPDIWIRLEGEIVFDKTLAHPEIVAAEIATDELAYLHTVALSDLQGPIGLENIRQDLRERAFVRSNGKVTELLLKTLVLQ